MFLSSTLLQTEKLVEMPIIADMRCLLLM